MKVTKITKPKETISISTETQKPDSWDSQAFDMVEIKKIQNIFRDKYDKHKNHVLELVISRMALSTVMSNVDETIRDNMNNAIAVNTDETAEMFDNIYTQALHLYACEEALSFIKNFEIKTELVTNVMATSKLQNKKRPLGLTNNKSPEEVVKDIEAVRNNLKTPMEADTDSPYGEPMDLMRKKPIGVVNKHSK